MEILIFAAIAGIVIFRLYKVLGQDVGFKSNAQPDMAKNSPLQKVSIPKNLETQLEKIQRIQKDFDLEDFLKGAHEAFKIILEAFNLGERESLKTLLDPKLYKIFEKNITDREKSKQTWENSLLRILSVEATDIQILKQSQVFITVKFISEQSFLTYDDSDNLIEGAPDQIDVITDLWTFSRDIYAEDPNWLLIKTTHVDS